MIRAGLGKLAAGLTPERLQAVNALAIRVFAAGFAFVMQLLLARWLGVAEYGVYAFVWTLVVIFAGACELGFSMSPQRFLPGYMAAGDTAHARGFVRFSYRTGFITSTCVALVGALGVHVLAPYMDAAYVAPLYLAFVCFPLYTLTDISDGTGRAFGWINLALVPTYIVRPAAILGLTALAHFSGWAEGAQAVMLAAIAATWTTGLVQLAIIRWRIARRLGGGPAIYEGRHWLAVSLPILAADGIYVLFTNVDVLLVGALLGARETGLYFAGVKVAMLLSLVSFAVGAAWGPRFSAAWSQGDAARMQRLTREVVHATFWPTALGAVVLVILGPFILRLFGEDFGKAHIILVILLAGLLARAATGAMDRLLSLAGQQKRMAFVFGGTLVMNVVLNLALIPLFGVYGAAIATSLSLTAQAAGIHHIARRHLGLHALVLPLRLSAARPAAQEPRP